MNKEQFSKIANNYKEFSITLCMTCLESEKNYFIESIWNKYKDKIIDLNNKDEDKACIIIDNYLEFYFKQISIDHQMKHEQYIEEENKKKFLNVLVDENFKQRYDTKYSKDGNYKYHESLKFSFLPEHKRYKVVFNPIFVLEKSKYLKEVFKLTDDINRNLSSYITQNDVEKLKESLTEQERSIFDLTNDLDFDTLTVYISEQLINRYFKIESLLNKTSLLVVHKRKVNTNEIIEEVFLEIPITEREFHLLKKKLYLVTHIHSDQTHTTKIDILDLFLNEK